MASPAEPHDHAGRALLDDLLDERNRHCGDTAEIDDRIRRTFERTVAILVLDMIGFSRLTQKHGIIHYLAMIERMRVAARPAVEGNGGRVIKYDADNLFATFGTPAEALEAALDILRSFDAVNEVTPCDRDLYGSFGIGFGPTLVVDGEDLFGGEMNLASKLGEDIAQASEIILTGAAHAALPPDLYRCDPSRFDLGGLGLDCYYFRSKFRPDGRPIVPTARQRRPEA